MSGETQENVANSGENTNEGAENQAQNQEQSSGAGVPESFKNDLHKYKRMARENQSLVEQLQNQIKEQNEQIEKGKANYKGLYETTKAELEEVKGKYTNLGNTIVSDKKISAVEKEAIKAGIDPDAMKLLNNFDMSDVEIETTSSGRYQVHGAKEFVERLKTQNAFMFKSQNAANVNNSPGNYQQNKELTTDDLIKLRKENHAEYLKQRQKMMQNRR